MIRRDAPPRLWEVLLTWALDPADADAILGDLEEEYRESVLPERGRRAARRWYRRMALDSLLRRWGRGRRRRLRPLAANRPNPGALMDSLAHDLRFTLRTLWRRKSFTAVVVATLAVAVGANAAMFAVVHGVLLEPLPYERPHELVTLWQASAERPAARGEVSLPNFDDWRARSTTVETMATVRRGTLTVTGRGDPEVVPAGLVSDGFFEVFGAAPVEGRGIARDESRPGGPDAVVVSHAFWQNRLGGDPAVIGSALELDGSPHTVVGVAPPAFDYPEGARVWIGELIDPERCGRGCVNFWVVGRLAPGTGVEAARQEMAAVASAMEEEHGLEGFRINLEPLADVEVGDVRTPLALLMGAVALLLLIACANIANLLLAAARDRAGELTVRAALGAGRGRIAEQLFTEAAVLAALGGAGGVALALAGTEGLKLLPGLDLPRLEGVAVDGAVLLFTLAVVALAVLLFGLVPAVTLSRRPLLTRSRGSTSRSPGRAALVATQVALSVVLFLGTALLLRTVLEVRAVSLGFDGADVEVVALSVPPGEVPDAEAAIRLHQRFREGLEALPGVVAVGGAFGAPLSAINVVSSVEVLGWTGTEDPPTSGVRSVTPGYLDALGIPLLQGRPVRASDDLGAPRVAWLNETAARTWFGGEDPLGRQIDLSASAGLPEREPRTVVGVVADTRFFGPRRDAPLEVYVPHAQNGTRYLEYFVETRPGAPPVAPEARAILADLNPRLPLRAGGLLAERVARNEADTRLWAGLLGLFALVALGLASLGLFGVVSYQVSTRRREIGVRMAVGATGGAVVALLVRQGLRPAVAGIVVGLALAWGAVGLLEGLLFGVAPTDPVAWVGGSAVLLAVVLLASLLPTLRAVRIDPARTLRSE